jgi:drug/metabolite transporter (DMT)-like permease
MRNSPRTLALLQALFVTFLWSTSWIMIKRTLPEIPPLTFAGLRYSLAFLVLLPGLRKYQTELRALSTSDWKRLIALGLVFYTLTQGGQFMTLNHLDAVPFSLLLNFTTVLVAVLGIFWLKEIPSRLQWFGTLVFLVGVFIFFSPTNKPSGGWLGFTLAGVTVLANAVAAILGRSVNRGGHISPLVVTATSMGTGALILLGIGLIVQGLPPLSPTTWAVVLWLAVVNTALAFFLWNKTLQVLTAVEATIINSTMLIQIAVLAWLFLGEELNLINVLGLALAATGVFIVNWKPDRRDHTFPNSYSSGKT